MNDVADVLVRIVAQRKRRFGSPDDRQEIRVGPATSELTLPDRRGSFAEAIHEKRGWAVIAEIKLGSPKLGDISDGVDPIRQAELYAANGAAALSVVVEPDFFYGSYELLEACRKASGLPAVAKDFVVDLRQLDAAADAGASAALLIAALYDQESLHHWAEAVEARGMSVLVETHSIEDVAKLAGRDWELVGVNNRDLRTFEVDLAHSEELVQHLPKADHVAESGLNSPQDLERLATAGFDAFLIGESLLISEDPAQKLSELLSYAR